MVVVMVVLLLLLLLLLLQILYNNKTSVVVQKCLRHRKSPAMSRDSRHLRVFSECNIIF
jgi:hypothetical protein